MSFYNCIVNNSAKEISNVIGNWHKISDSKTQREWESSIQNKNIEYYIYDYKSSHHIKENEKYPYHIGTNSEQDSIQVVEFLKSLDLNAYQFNFFNI